MTYRERRKDRERWKKEEKWDKRGGRVGKVLSGRNRKGLTDGWLAKRNSQVGNDRNRQERQRGTERNREGRKEKEQEANEEGMDEGGYM